MRKIQKTFSLEPMTSRMASVIPAYRNNKLYFFDDEHLKAREYEFPSNYGMIPMRLSYKLEGDEYKLSCDNDAITISFERLSKWYYFFNEYYHLLNDYGHCNRTYTSATEYYYYESGTRYSYQMVYGTSEQTYIDLDAEFEAKGGKVDTANTIVSGATDIGFYKWICDNIVPTYYISKEYSEYWKRGKLYYPDVIKWIAWLGERLNYEDVYVPPTDKDKEHWNCKDNENINCCDCEEYFNRGGKREYQKMKDWYDSLQDSIIKMNNSIKENEKCFIPTMDDKIQLYNSLDDLGQFSIFSKEYELGIDYRTASYGDTENTYGGTVAEVSGNTMILKEGDIDNDRKGFKFNETYMENQYDEDSWDNYTEKYINENSNEFIADGYSFYAYDNDGVMYIGKNENELRDKFTSAYTYDITSTDAILINDVLYDIQKSEYGEYDWDNQYMSGKTFFVYRENDTSTPYTLINGKKIYAEWYPNPNPKFDNKPCYYFTFFKNKDLEKRKENCVIKDKSFNITDYKPFGRKINLENAIDYISYIGQIFQIDGETLKIDDGEHAIEYLRVHGYTYDKDNNLIYIIKDDEDNLIAVDSVMLEKIPESNVEDNKVIVGLTYEPTIYSAKEISGHTVSRLTDLESTDVLVDDIGNKIDGKYNPNIPIFEGDKDYDDTEGNVKFALIVKNRITIYNGEERRTEAERELPEGTPYEEKNCNTRYNHQPPQGAELDLLYEVGNTSNINRISGLTIEDLNEVSEDTVNYFIGNIITNMVFYYKDVDGNVVEETIKEWGDYNSSLEAIHASQAERDNINNSIIFDGDDIYCDVTYYIGATLSRKKDEPFKLAYSDNKAYNYGVEYKETVKFVKENREYYLRKERMKQIPMTFNSVSAHSISYPIYVYKMTQELTEVEGDVYNTFMQTPLASFKSEINLISSDLTTNYSSYKDMDAYNNIHVSPTFKQEYMLGISSLENIDSDIYIERGINAAFEKHLKLGEVVSLEALEQFSNGYFKIMNT